MEDVMALFSKKNNNFDEFGGDDQYYGEGNFDTLDANGAEDDGFEMQSFDAAPAEPAPAFTAAVALKIVNPKEYKDSVEIANLLMNGNTVLLNIEGIAKDQAIRLLDYLAGAVHVAGGLMTKVSKTTIVIAPKNVDVSSIEAMVSGN